MPQRGDKEKVLARIRLRGDDPWTGERVLAEIRERYRLGRPLTDIRRQHYALFIASHTHCGGWRKALALAGIPLSAYQKWTPENIICALHAYAQQGFTLAEIFKADRGLKSAIGRYFAGTRQALLAAGFPAESIPCRLGPHRVWSKAAIVDEIQSLHANGMPLNRVYQDRPDLLGAAMRYFGGWSNALQAAGFRPAKVAKWSRELVVERLVAWHRAKEFRLHVVDPALARYVARYFGSVEKARESLGLEPSRHRWSPNRVIEAIQDGYVAGKRLAVHGFGNRSLAAAARRRFGSWLSAVAAAGLSAEACGPGKRRWTAEEVLEAIRERARQGLSMTNVWRDDRRLYEQAKTRFHGWRSAMCAAGLPVKTFRERRRPTTNNKFPRQKEQEK